MPRLPKKNKLNRYKLYKKLQPVKLVTRLQEVILQDFIIKLLKSKDPIIRQEYDSIFIIIDKFIKWGYFITYIKEILAKEVAQIYIKEVFTRHRILDKIILDKDIRFILVYWQVFIVKQGVRIIMSTAYYLQTDSQIKRLNQILKQYLRHYINYIQNNWVSLLPIIQFVYNIIPQKGLKILLFKINYGYKLRTLLLL